MKKMVMLAMSIIAFSSTRAQTFQYRNLVMEGAGVKGFAYAGALQVLDSMGILQKIQRVAGTSVGAIQGALLAVGYSSTEIIELTAHIPLKQFNDGGGMLPGGIHRLRKQFGWYKGEKIAHWMEGLIAAKTGNGQITFAELHALSAQKGYKDLYITGTDLTYQTLRVFSYEHYPNMRICDAVRISLSIPLYYRAVLMDDSGRVYKKPAGKQLLHVMVDGGVLSNYPIYLFDSARYVNDRAAYTNTAFENRETLGLLMEIPEQIKYNAQQPGVYPFEIDNMTDYLKALYHTLIDKANPEVTNPNSIRRTIAIDNLNLSGRVRKLPRKTITALVENGKEGARRFFNTGETDLETLKLARGL
ncbi:MULTISPECIES: patatin-like phospholipase family protein [Niastella]|uniref:Patatin-like phospholipase family protein n=1 Tax=Niastella soli TaxID=2821487 RepID=A0ABS3YVG4_9BACT|nr:patatin-like phospholipase family protein [Niastella soli]MBO9201892.1 patatin-like phospholipase family protein [Niastella soli]